MDKFYRNSHDINVVFDFDNNFNISSIQCVTKKFDFYNKISIKGKTKWKKVIKYKIIINWNESERKKLNDIKTIRLN